MKYNKFNDIKEIKDDTIEKNNTIDDFIDETIKDETAGVQSVKELFKINQKDGKSDIDLKTELSDVQIKNMAIIEFIGEIPHMILTNNKFVVVSIIDKIKRMQVSRNRKGREEAVSVFKAENDNQAGGMNLMKKIFQPKT
jgi:hypothetical protein